MDCTRAQLQALIGAWVLGLTDEHAAGLAGVKPATVADWLRRGEADEPGYADVLAARSRARAEFAAECAGKMSRSRDWKAHYAGLQRLGYYAPKGEETPQSVSEASKRILDSYDAMGL